MSLGNVHKIIGSALQANRLWIDVIANNVANANTTRTANGEPFRRQQPVFAEMVDKEMQLNMSMDAGFGDGDEGFPGQAIAFAGKGVHATQIVGDANPFKIVYNPNHPDADASGFVRMPNISVINEMVDMLAAQRGYDAGVQIANAAKTMGQKALEIGR